MNKNNYANEKEIEEFLLLKLMICMHRVMLLNVARSVQINYI